MTHQALSLEKYWKLFPATFKEQCHEDFAVLGQFCAKIITFEALKTFALIVSAHPYCARKFTCHVMRQVCGLTKY